MEEELKLNKDHYKLRLIYMNLNTCPVAQGVPLK